MQDLTDSMADFDSPCGSFKLTFDDDGKVAYAYLKCGDDIIGDVWLYNRCPTPEQPEWSDWNNLPFANCKEYMNDLGYIQAGVELIDINVKWEYRFDKLCALVYFFGSLVASVGPSDKPGYSRFASKDGPLAKVMK